MPAWKDYQEETARYYRGLGLSAEVEAVVAGARATHNVDVAVRGSLAGVPFLWVVECKCWARPVRKEAVAALSEIVQDVGADRGVLLSRSGFQPGATAMASNNNITLSSLDELKSNTSDEFTRFQCALLSSRCEAAVETMHARQSFARGPGGIGFVSHDPPGSNYVSWLIRGRISLLQSAISRAVADRWPIDVSVVIPSAVSTSGARPDDGVESKIRVYNLGELVPVVNDAIATIEREIGVEDRSARPDDSRHGH